MQNYLERIGELDNIVKKIEAKTGHELTICTDEANLSMGGGIARSKLKTADALKVEKAIKYDVSRAIYNQWQSTWICASVGFTKRTGYFAVLEPYGTTLPPYARTGIRVGGAMKNASPLRYPGGKRHGGFSTGKLGDLMGWGIAF